MIRDPIYQALFALGSSLTWGGGRTFAFASRRVRTFANIPAWPAFCQAEHDENIADRTKMPNKNTLGAIWLIYHNAGKDKDVVPATESNAILDAVDMLFPAEDEGYHQTLGGLVHKATVSGKILKEHGDLDGQALLIVPLKILIP